MRVMVLVKATPRSEAEEFGTAEELAALDRYNQALVTAGVVVVSEGLQPSNRAVRVVFDDEGEASVLEGPFAPVEELVASYSIWEVPTMTQAVEWVKRSPLRHGQIELRRILDEGDFSRVFDAEMEAAKQRSLEHEAE